MCERERERGERDKIATVKADFNLHLEISISQIQPLAEKKFLKRKRIWPIILTVVVRM